MPNEDSQLPEFDETNLFSLNRFPGHDRLETGLRANLGVSYTRHDPAGWSLGRDPRPGASAPSPTTSSPRAPASPAAGRTTSAPSSLDFAWGLTLVNRALFDDDLDFRRNEFALRLRRRARRPARRLRLPRRGRLQPDPRPAARDQRVRARRPLPRPPELGAARPLALRRGDATATCAPAPAITYGNECAEFDLSVSRRYTSSDNRAALDLDRLQRAAGGDRRGRRAGLAGAGLHGARDLTGGRSDDAQAADDRWRSAVLAARRPAVAAEPVSRRR